MRTRRGGSIGLTVLALVTALHVSTPAVQAADPPTPSATRVDPSFTAAFRSRGLSDLDDEAKAVVVQPDGAVVTAGYTDGSTPAGTSDMLVARFTPVGDLDPSFGTGGKVVLGTPGEPDEAQAVALQPDGKIVVAGLIGARLAVVRLTPAGRLDADFQGGIVAMLGGTTEPLTALAVQPDGKIVFTGGVVAAGRLQPDGIPDATFGVDGLVMSTGLVSNHAPRYAAVAVQPDGRIVVAGSTQEPSWGAPNDVGIVARYTARGLPDLSFGRDGWVVVDLDEEWDDSGTLINALALQPDGRIVLAGHVFHGQAAGSPSLHTTPNYGPVRHVAVFDLAVIRLLPDGRLDTEFAASGRAVPRLTTRTVPSQPDLVVGPIGTPEAELRGTAVALAPDGSIFVAGYSYELERVPLVVKYTAAGLLDTTFGHDGAFIVDMAGRWGVTRAMQVQGDGRLVLAGSTRPGLFTASEHWDLIVGLIIPGSSAGTVWTWGWNASGQLGDGTTVTRAAPAQVPGLERIVALSAGAYHTLALRGDGTVWAWGRNAVGQLGDGTTVDRLRPVRVPGLTGIVGVSAGGQHSLAVRGDGTVWAWGWNGFGQLGDGTTTTRPAPVRIPGLDGMAEVSAGLYHSLAIREDGMGMAWGYNAVGQLGDGTLADHHSPVWLPLLPAAYAFHQLSAGSLHSLAVGVNASFAATGWNAFQQVNGRGGDMTGFGMPLPQVAHVAAAGWYHSLLVHTNGTVLAAGWNALGQLGDGTTVSHGWAPVPGLKDVWKVGAGGEHSLALTEDGRLLAWGWNAAGQLGTGSAVDALSPVAVPLTGVRGMSAGLLHTAVIRG